jgi:hypothetical protein
MIRNFFKKKSKVKRKNYYQPLDGGITVKYEGAFTVMVVGNLTMEMYHRKSNDVFYSMRLHNSETNKVLDENDYQWVEPFVEYITGDIVEKKYRHALLMRNRNVDNGEERSS